MHFPSLQSRSKQVHKMSRHIAGVCLFVLGLFVYVESWTGCSCPPQHPQQAFCDDNNFVLQARILSRRKLPNGSRVYKVKVLKDYKNAYDPIRGIKRIFTGSSRDPCCAYFKRKATYIISGQKRGNKLVTSVCSWIQKICTITAFQRFALKTGLYKTNCQCKVKDCIGGNCPPPTGEDCVMKSNRDCFLKKNACVKKSQYGALRCGWKSDACASAPHHVHIAKKEVVHKSGEHEILDHIAKPAVHEVHKLFDPHLKPHDHQGHVSGHVVPGPYTNHVYKKVDHVGHSVAGH